MDACNSKTSQVDQSGGRLLSVVAVSARLISLGHDAKSSRHAAEKAKCIHSHVRLRGPTETFISAVLFTALLWYRPQERKADVYHASVSC